MKKLHAIFLLLFMSGLLLSCGGDQAEATTGVGDEAAPQGNQLSTNSKPTYKDGEAPIPAEKLAANKGISPTGDNPMVESTQKLQEAPGADKGIDYAKLSKTICNCSKKYLGTAKEQEGDLFVPNNSSEFKDAVDCFFAEKKKMGIGEINRSNLLPGIKSQCHNIPPKLVMELVIAIGKEQQAQTAQ